MCSRGTVAHSSTLAARRTEAMTRPSPADKRQAFHALHQSGCFVIPNPWNVGTARYLQGLGFKALATTSSGHAHSLGFADGTKSATAEGKSKPVTPSPASVSAQPMPAT